MAGKKASFAAQQSEQSEDRASGLSPVAAQLGPVLNVGFDNENRNQDSNLTLDATQKKRMQQELNFRMAHANSEDQRAANRVILQNSSKRNLDDE